MQAVVGIDPEVGDQKRERRIAQARTRCLKRSMTFDRHDPRRSGFERTSCHVVGFDEIEPRAKQMHTSDVRCTAESRARMSKNAARR